MARDVIILEFNELVPTLIDRFISAGDLPNFKRLRDQSVVATTDAEEAPPTLEPWIQWVTVHTGLSYGEHRVFHLNDGAALKKPRIWDVVSAAGKTVWICGSMNAAAQSDTINGMILPDPWATEIAPKPEGVFEPYLNLVRAFVHDYTSGKPKIALRDVVAFGRFMLANGLSINTVRDTVRQLATERFNGSQWRRAAIMDRLQWDVFRKFYRRTRPALSTFFLNSTAHYQHYFWRNMDPQDFDVRSDPASQARYEDAIRFGYRSMDRIVGECLALAGPETSIVLCTALSQQPMRDYEDVGGKQIFKAHDPSALFAFAGIDGPYEYAPVMAEQFFLNFANAESAANAAAKLSALTLSDGSELMFVETLENKVFAGCKLVAPPIAGVDVVNPQTDRRKPFDVLFYPVEAVRSGMHHADGVLWIRQPGRAPGHIGRKIALTELGATFLDLAGVQNSSWRGIPIPELSDDEVPQPVLAAA